MSLPSGVRMRHGDFSSDVPPPATYGDEYLRACWHLERRRGRSPHLCAADGKCSEGDFSASLICSARRDLIFLPYFSAVAQVEIYEQVSLCLSSNPCFEVFPPSPLRHQTGDFCPPLLGANSSSVPLDDCCIVQKQPNCTYMVCSCWSNRSTF